MNNLSIGIDFGTSNSTCAVFEGAGARLISLEGDKTTLPSSIFFCEDGEIFYGRKATQAYIDGEDGRLMRGLKSVLGTSLMAEKTIVNKQPKKFIEILESFVRHLKEKAESDLGKGVENLVLGRPVHFHDNNPGADLESQQVLESIAKSTGFKNIVFQYEPIAAAFAHERRLNREKLALVVDLGGGTSDFAVIKLSPHKSFHEDRKRDILATAGVRVGGTNFDTSLSMTSFMPFLGLNSTYRSHFDGNKHLNVPARTYADLSEWPRVHSAQTLKSISETESLLRRSLEPQKISRLLKLQREKLGHAFLQIIEQAKIDLTDHAEVTKSLSALRFDFEVQVSRTDFEDAIIGKIKKISGSIDDCIRLSAVRIEDIDLVILTGGSSELPVINQLIMQKFPHAAISKDDKFGSVGLGLAYSAEQIFATNPDFRVPLTG